MKVLFLCNQVNERLLKQLKALQTLENVDAVLVSVKAVSENVKQYCVDSFSIELVSLDMKMRLERYSPFVNSVTKKYSELIGYVLRTHSVDLVHVHIPFAFPFVACLADLKMPLIVDIYDPYRFYGWSKIPSTKEMSSEKLILEQCDGFVSKFDSKLYEAFDNAGVACSHKPRLTWADYCDAESARESPKENPNEKLQLIYAGVGSYSLWPACFGGNNQYYKSSRCLLEAGFDVSLYSSAFHGGVLSILANRKYLNLAAQYENFTLSGYISSDALRQKLCLADFGLQLHDFSSTFHHPVFGQTSFGNKFFAYLEAGLPIIVNDELEYNSQWVVSNNVGVSLPIKALSELKHLLKYIDYKSLAYNSWDLSKGSLSLQFNAKRLGDFYSSWL